MSAPFKRVVIVVADGCGVGGAEDAAAYGDQGRNTLGNLSRAMGGLSLPNLGKRGLGNLTAIEGVPPELTPVGAYGAMREASAGKDTITGHWEFAGIVTKEAMPVYPQGFPPSMMDTLTAAWGRGFLGNKPASGTEIIEELGVEHLATGKLIVYTSADSVLQIAAHEDVVPIEQLYAICEKARTIVNDVKLGRVIARPFVGKPGAFKRTYNRKDWPLIPPELTVLDRLSLAGVSVVAVGKIRDIYAGRGITTSLHTEGNTDGLKVTLEAFETLDRGVVFVNLVDFDMLYGHRNDRPGFARALAELDAWVPLLTARMWPGDVAFMVADHGNDPTKTGSDHTREHVPLLVWGPGLKPVNLGVRTSFCDLGQTLADGFGLSEMPRGNSFLSEILP